MGAWTCQYGTTHEMCRCPKQHTMECNTPEVCNPEHTVTDLGFNRMNAIVSQIRYRPGWLFYVYMETLSNRQTMYFLQLDFTRPDRDSGEEKIGKARPVLLAKDISEVGLVQACLGVILDVEEHEARERFFYGGMRVFDPHRKAF